MSSFKKDILYFLEYDSGVKAEEAGIKQLYNAVSKAAMKSLGGEWVSQEGEKKACYFSAEFLVGRMIYSNLYNLNLTKELEEFLSEINKDSKIFEEIDDNALGNGGLGRLAACFLDSAATHGIKLDGYGIRYKYGLFKQSFEDGFQKEWPDDWQRFGDPWSVRREENSEIVEFADQTVRAVPYDMPVIGYGAVNPSLDSKNNAIINTLRLWQAEPIEEFNFNLFNEQKYDFAVKEKNRADDINAVLYPNDDTRAGKQLRLKQQYFFSSASIQSIVRNYIKKHGTDFTDFPNQFAIQLNDTHPVIAIPELLRILMGDYYLDLDEGLRIIKETFAYTNHTIMAEALEKWDIGLILSVIPHVYPYIVIVNDAMKRELHQKGIKKSELYKYSIIQDGLVHMARLAIYASRSVNGVAEIHTEILKNDALNEWFRIYPERFNNKTNGITPRRWLGLCNKELSEFITENIGDGWIYNLDEINKMIPFAEDNTKIDEFIRIKKIKKQQLCEFIEGKEGIRLNPDFVFDVQIKRLHEYKRQLLNAFSIMDIYFGLKDGRIRELCPTVFLFGAKAAPGYKRAKGIIKYINEIADLVNNDPEVNDKMRVLFVQNYNVSYAEKIIPATDISEQISTAGTEASGTGNMKFMLNGAVTLGTLDGANVEIVREAGMENNYIFGGTVEDFQSLGSSYNPVNIYNNNMRIKKVVDTLIDGTFSDGKTGIFKELYDSILEGASWHAPDVYKLLYDFESYCDTKVLAINGTAEKREFAKKCFVNMACAGKFSSDRTIMDYDREIWHTSSEK